MADTPTSLKGLFQGLFPDTDGTMQGVVISLHPLKIRALNDDKLTIPASMLVVTQRLSDFKVTIGITDGGEESLTECTIYNALKQGDKVHLLPLKGGKQYLVLDRVM